MIHDIIDMHKFDNGNFTVKTDFEFSLTKFLNEVKDVFSIELLGKKIDFSVFPP